MLEGRNAPAPMRATVKILIVVDHPLFRAGLRMLLAAIGRNVECLEAGTAQEALGMLARHPDTRLCVLDLDMRDEQGIATIARIRQSAPAVAVVVISGDEDSATILSCVAAGATSYIPKSVSPEILTNALQRVMSGTIYLPENVLGTA
jgi:two-component system nitrate/nitrite response regulator NarL